MTRDEMIEVMARSIDEDPWDYTLSHSPNQCCPDCNAARSASIERAVEVLSALEAAGYVVVPKADLEWRDWNDEEIAALPHNGSFPILVMERGDNHVWLAPDEIGQPCDPWALTDEDKATFVWRPVITAYERAMLAASKQEKTDG